MTVFTIDTYVGQSNRQSPHLKHLAKNCSKPREIFCFRCHITGHISSRYEDQGNGRRVAGAPGATHFHSVVARSLPFAEVRMEGKVVKAFVDIGCMTSIIVHSRVVG